MNLREWDEVLKFVQALTRWPPVALAAVWLLRDRVDSFTFQGDGFAIGLKLRDSLLSLRTFAARSDPAVVKQVVPQLLDALLQDMSAPRKASRLGKSKGAAVTAQAAFSPGIRVDGHGTEEQTVLKALSDSRLDWQSRDRLIAVTDMAQTDLDKTLAVLIQQDLVRPAFDKTRRIIFGLRERVDNENTI